MSDGVTLTTGHDVRLACRSGEFDRVTSGQAPGYVQGNLAIWPREWADEFLRFCQANPKPCPVLAVAELGNATFPRLAADLDIRTDLPRYRVWREGELVEEPCDIRSVWREDLVSFVIGCSFSFEQPLLQANVPLRHIARASNVPMYRTSVPTTPVGRLHGPLVVSMRPLAPADAIRAIQITSRLPAVHGAPVHIGFPEAIGIADLNRPRAAIGGQRHCGGIGRIDGERLFEVAQRRNHAVAGEFVRTPHLYLARTKRKLVLFGRLTESVVAFNI
jgi:uncharacterized protein YcsI (UPF0317 family)